MTDIKKDFVVVQKNRVRFVYAYLAIALCLGIGVGIGFVIGQNGDFQAGEARTILLRPGVQEIRFGTKGGEAYKIIPAGSANAKDEGFAVAIKGSKYWYQRGRPLSGTSWINYAGNDQPPQGTRVRFTIPVSLPAGTSLESKIVILADDTASVMVNDQKVADESAGPYPQCAETGITCIKPTTITVPAGVFHGGPNTVVVEVLQAGKGKTPFGLDLMGSILMDTNQAGGQPPAPLAQCLDGLDNDGDGKVDAADPGCSGDKDDNSEADAETGTLRFSLSSASPVSHITYDEITDYVAAFRAAASGGLATISEVTFKLAGYTTVKNVMLRDGPTVLATKPAAATVTFTGLAIPIQNGTSRDLDIYLQFGTVGPNAGTSGENVQVKLASVKQAQGTQYSPEIAANDVYVFAAIPVVAETAIGNTPILGAMEIYKWTVTSYGGEVKAKQFGLKVGITDQAPNGALTLGNFNLFKNGAPYTSNVTIRDQAGNDLKSDSTGFSEADTHVYITFGSTAQGEESVNGSATYSLWATPTGFSSSEEDSFKVEMLADRKAGSNPIMRYIVDEDYDANEIVVGMGSNSGDKGGAGLPQFLIWSDNSATPHSASVRDATGSILPPDSLTFSADWWNGYLVKSYPLAGNTFTY